MNDLLFTSYEGYWHGPTDAKTQLHCLSNDIQLGGMYGNDTVFFRKTYSTTFWNDKLNYNETSLYTCERESPNDSIHNISQRGLIQLFTNNQSISGNTSWLSDTITLTTHDFCYGPYSVVETTDSIYNYIRKYKTDCHNLPGDSIVYIGLRKLINGSYKYGWLQFSVSNSHIVHIYKSAIEK